MSSLTSDAQPIGTPQIPLPPELQPMSVGRVRTEDVPVSPAYVPINPHPLPHGGPNANIDFTNPHFRAGLPTRDYPNPSPADRQTDPSANPNYVPPPKEPYYPEEYMRRLRGIDRNSSRESRRSRMFDADTGLLVEQLQIPMMLGLIFFLFSLPLTHEIVRRQFGGILPITNENNTLNSNGIGLLALCFTAVVHFGFGSG